MKKILIILFFTIYINFVHANSDRLVELSWEPISGAVSYEIEVTKVINDEMKPLTKEATYSFTWRKKLPSGEYAYRIRSLDFRKVPGPWSGYQKFYVNLPSVELIRPYENEIIEGIDKPQLKMLFAWKEVLNARYYLLEIIDAQNKTIYKEFQNDTKVFVLLPTANTYSWRVEALKSKNDPIPPFPSNPRIVDIKGKPLEAVSLNLKRTQSKIAFKWSKSKGAKSYAISLYQNKNNNWISMTSKPNYKKHGWAIPSKKLKKGRYKFIVDAFAPGRSTSKRSAIEFNWSGKNTSDIEKKLEDPVSVSSTNKVIQLVRSAHAAFFIFGTRSGNYTGVQNTSDLADATDVNGGISAQRFNIGYQYITPNSNSIWNISAEMDNLVNSKENWQQYAFDIRYDLTWGKDFKFDLGAGVYFKQSPFIYTKSTSDNQLIETISTVGVSAYMKFKARISERWHLELLGVPRYHLLALAIPTGSLNPSLEYRYTARILYQFGDLVDFTLGYESSLLDLSFTGFHTDKGDNTVNLDLSGLHASVNFPF